MQDSTYKELLINKVITAAYDVYDSMGPGLSERNYQKGMEYELEAIGLSFSRYHRCEAFHRGRSCDPYYVDLFVENTLVVELKVCRAIEQGHLGQTLNYMHLTKVKDGVVINFGPYGVRVRRLWLE